MFVKTSLPKHFGTDIPDVTRCSRAESHIKLLNHYSTVKSRKMAIPNPH